MAQRTPTMLFAGDFRLLRPLSTGGMGALYVAEQVSTGKHRALKVLLPEYGSDPESRRRFVQEARVGAKIESDHVVEVVGAGIAPSGTPWLAMELLAGEDLADLVRRRGRLSRDEVLSIFEQLCHAVGAAHRAQVVHRDLKPENIFLAESRHAGVTFTVKVLDFGVSKIISGGTDRRTAPVGTPLWMAPEQTETRAITPAVDIWSLGLIAFYLLTGRHFWLNAGPSGSTPRDLLREIVLDPIPAARCRAQELNVQQHLPEAFDAWFARCVTRDPAKRFANVPELLSCLHSLLTSAQADPRDNQVPDAAAASKGRRTEPLVQAPKAAWTFETPAKRSPTSSWEHVASLTASTELAPPPSAIAMDRATRPRHASTPASKLWRRLLPHRDETREPARQPKWRAASALLLCAAVAAALASSRSTTIVRTSAAPAPAPMHEQPGTDAPQPDMVFTDTAASTQWSVELSSERSTASESSAPTPPALDCIVGDHPAQVESAANLPHSTAARSDDTGTPKLASASPTKPHATAKRAKPSSASAEARHQPNRARQPDDALAIEFPYIDVPPRLGPRPIHLIPNPYQ